MRTARYTCALLLVLACSVARADDPVWLVGVNALKGGDYATAESTLAGWLVERVNEGIHSPEGHYNLGLALWHQKKAGRAMFHWATATTLQPNPLATWRSLRFLAGAERQIGVPTDAVSESTAFRAWMLVTGNWVLAVSTLALWCLVGCWVLAWVQGRRAHHAAKMLALVPLSLLLVAGLAALARVSSPDFGVLDGEKTVTVFRVADDKPEHKLVDLPAGALVSSSGTERNFVRITEPVSGWIASASYQAIRQR